MRASLKVKHFTSAIFAFSSNIFFPCWRRLKSFSKYSTKEHLLYLVNETLLIDIDRLNNNLEQQKLFCLNHIKRSCISFPYNVHRVVSSSLISFSKGSKPQQCVKHCVKHGPFKRIHQRTTELLQNLLCNHWYPS